VRLPEGRASACFEALFYPESETYELGKLPLARNQPREFLIDKKSLNCLAIKPWDMLGHLRVRES